MSKTLVAYFSASGTTAGVAKDLAGAIHARTSRPALANLNAHVSAYDTILLGFPIWWGVAPTIVNTFLACTKGPAGYPCRTVAANSRRSAGRATWMLLKNS